ncbi:hypothetical protein [Scytonema sp. PRP1]
MSAQPNGGDFRELVNNPRGKSPGSIPTPGDESEGRILALLNHIMFG